MTESLENKIDTYKAKVDAAERISVYFNKGDLMTGLYAIESLPEEFSEDEKKSLYLGAALSAYSQLGKIRLSDEENLPYKGEELEDRIRLVGDYCANKSGFFDQTSRTMPSIGDYIKEKIGYSRGQTQ